MLRRILIPVAPAALLTLTLSWPNTLLIGHRGSDPDPQGSALLGHALDVSDGVAVPQIPSICTPTNPPAQWEDSNPNLPSFAEDYDRRPSTWRPKRVRRYA